MGPSRFDALPEYAFPRLRALLGDLSPGGPEIPMSIGEPQHPYPDFVRAVLNEHADLYSKYPPNEGVPALRDSVAGWVGRRYGVAVDPATQILPLNGTREGLFMACLALCPVDKNGARPVVLMPNPFYQCYAAAAIAAGAEPVYVNATEETGFLPDFAALPAGILDRTAIVYLCSPANPQGACASLEYWRDLLALAEKHDFTVFADECYSELWFGDAPPVGALTANREGDPERVVLFNSLSKRSNLAGLRSGIAVGGPKSIAAIRGLRAYGGAPLPLPAQYAAAAAWADEAHVVENRARYAEKIALADRMLGDLPGYRRPEGGFFLWLETGDGEAATRRLWREQGVKVLPGAYLSRDDSRGVNPGKEYIRAALVAPLETCRMGLAALRTVLDKEATP